ncbi:MULTISPECIES: EAL domain-containing protein [Burkholderia]|uniref:EAL domain-containing protein n=1 Tax=Burkholderia TaxID=32008 RepID=UPI0015C6158C|nr:MULTISPECIES: EAL domain-containing protein [Burkholderia]EKS9796422.1 EAL domain-containing protein [Burkholderia cepacia]EKS9803248.1 EAL domain-containing protein [Burkholderia cepacia]EKS9813739.1 EAL domain-containing protein [Burkholderia cepacia]EKS9821584.1 EAL domain-containing protein [Burkholderia cepacia]EKS9825017.1 EAL domain-containing protein [Burkholderia cepacia]
MLVVSAGLALAAWPQVTKIVLARSVAALGMQVVQQIDVVFDSAARTLADVNASPYAACSPQDRRRLRSASVQSKYIKDVGRLSGPDLLCTTMLGVLPRPFASTRQPFRLTDAMSAFWAVPLLSSPDTLGLVVAGGRANLLMDLDAFRVPPPPGLHYVIGLKGHPAALVIGLGKRGVPEYDDAGQVPGFRDGKPFCSARVPLCTSVVVTPQALANASRRAAWLLGIAAGAAGCCLGLGARMLHRRWAALPAQMRRALANGQFVLRYQPIVALGASSRIVSAEALIRWTGGPAAPDVFIAEAERAGMIVDVTAFVVRTVLREMRVLFDSRPDFCVTINVSAPELRDGSLLATLNRCWPAGLSRRHVGVELTERSTVELPEIVPALRQLRALGHPVYIDDFGTGYSSLSLLQHLAIDYIKVDRSLLPVAPQHDGTSFIPEILAIARRLGAGLVFEGVETREQADMLDIPGQSVRAQGWYFGRPDTVEALRHAIAEQSPGTG